MALGRALHSRVASPAAETNPYGQQLLETQMIIRQTLPRLLATSALVLLPLCAFAAGPVMVKSVEVEVALEDVTNVNAAERFANIKTDLENAIAARLVDRTDDENGVKITVDISELELSNAYSEIFNLADSRLAGVVQVIGTADNPDSTRYELVVDVEAAQAYFPEGTVLADLSADSAVYYDTLITAFADSVVLNLDK
jgi:hypothetical protein